MAGLLMCRSDPSAVPPDRVPTDGVAVPTDGVAVPTDRVALPTDRVALPTDRVAVPTDRVAVPTAVPVAVRRSMRRSARRWGRLGAGLFVAAMVVVYLVVAAPTIRAAFHHLAGASLPWLLVGLLATVASLIVFAMLRMKTLAVAGARVSLGRNVAVSYGAGAVHTTLPAGGVFSTTYAYRHLRSWGASTSATTWSMTVTGLLSTVTLSAIATAGVLLTGMAGGSPLRSIVSMVTVAVVLCGLVHVTRHPAALVRLAQRLLAGTNRLRKRPADTGFGRLSEIVDDLRAIRPSGADWAASVVLSMLNWLLDLGCLAACCAAVGVHVTPAALLITYAAGMAAGSLVPVPGGLGAVETAMTVGLTVAGAAASPALAAVLLYRLMSTGSVVLVGWIVVAAQAGGLRGSTSQAWAKLTTRAPRVPNRGS